MQAAERACAGEMETAMRRTAIDEAISTARGKVLPGARRAFAGRAKARVECDVCEASGDVT